MLMHTQARANYYAIILTASASAVFFVFGMAQAFTGPTAAAPSGSSIINVSGNNIGIGTASPATELDVEGTSAGIMVGNSNSSYAISPESSGAAITSSGNYVRWITGGSEGMRLTNGNLVVTGIISGSYTGTASAANISAGTFGANIGGGNYIFPSTVSAGIFSGSGSGLSGTAGSLTSGAVQYLGPQTANTSGSLTSGLTFGGVYANGYPTSYGNVLNLAGGGYGQLLIGWSGTTGGTADNYIRSLRDSAVGTNNWSSWAKILTDQN